MFGQSNTMQNCVQCSKKLELTMFDDGKKSCRTCLERKRKNYQKRKLRKNIARECSRCKKKKQARSFSSSTRKYCIPCVREYNKEYRTRRGEELLVEKREYHHANKDEINKKRRVYRQENKEKVFLQKRKHRQKYRGRIRERKRRYREENPEKVRAYFRNYNKTRLRTDPVYKLKSQLRGRLRTAIRTSSAESRLSHVRDLGCSVDFLCEYLEKQFYSHPRTGKKMSWENWGVGKGKWQIDHIKEFREIDMNDEKQVLEVIHYTNLQPLWTVDHVKKTAAGFKL